MASSFLLSLGLESPNALPTVLYLGVDRTAATAAIQAAGEIAEGRIIKLSASHYVSRLNFEKTAA